MSNAYLGLGTNLGNQKENLNKALEAISLKMSISKQSSLYETTAWGYTEQPNFLNQVIQVETDLSLLRLLNFLKKTEVKLGRVENFRYGPRLIDIDILFYDDLVITTSRLQIPHPMLPERAFVLVPLNEIAPGLVHPVLKKTITELLEELPNQTGVRLCE